MKRKISISLIIFLFFTVCGYAQVQYLTTPAGSPFTGTLTKNGLSVYAAGSGAQYELDSGAHVEIRSGRSTVLMPGFKVKKGAYFNAKSSLEFKGTALNNYKMPRHILEGYLSKYITMQGFADNVDDINIFEADPGDPNDVTLGDDDWLTQPQFIDDVRMILNTGAKFIGNAAGVWGIEEYVERFPDLDEDAARFNRATLTANYVHQRDSEIILQAAIFEYITQWQLNHSYTYNGHNYTYSVTIPDWVKDEYNLSLSERTSLGSTFNYYNIIYDTLNTAERDVPDISKLECQLYFYYRARKYIDAGYESIHFGRMWDQMSRNDSCHIGFQRLLDNIRDYASIHARRKFVLITCHGTNFYCGGTVIPGIQDFYTEPVRMQDNYPVTPTVPIGTNNDGSAILASYQSGTFEVPIYNNPSKDTTRPYVVEIDNYGMLCYYGVFTDYDTYYPWGWDEITWFAMQGLTYNSSGVIVAVDSTVRNNWLEYAYSKVRCLDQNGFLGMPGRREITPSSLYIQQDCSSGQSTTLYQSWLPEVMVGTGSRAYYYANTTQYGQEDKIKELWNAKEYLLTGINCNLLPRNNTARMLMETDVADHNAAKTYEIMPNPFSEYITIKSIRPLNEDQNISLGLYDMTGRKAFEIQTDGNSLLAGFHLPTSTIYPGIYLLTVNTGDELVSYKVIKY